MAPNPLHLFTPHKWFSRRRDGAPQTSRYNRQETPVPGLYHYIPGKGNYLVVRDSDNTPLNPPIPVVFSKVLDRYLFQQDFADRKEYGLYERAISSDYRSSRNNSSGNLAPSAGAAGAGANAGATQQPPPPSHKSAPPKKRVDCAAFFFRLDDNTYVKAYDQDGVFLSPSLNDRYKRLPRTEDDAVPRFKRIRLVNRSPPLVSDAAASGLESVPQPGLAASTRPPSPRGSWDETGPVSSFSSKKTATASTNRTLQRSLSLPDMSGLQPEMAEPTVHSSNGTTTISKPIQDVEGDETRPSAFRKDSARDGEEKEREVPLSASTSPSSSRAEGTGKTNKKLGIAVQSSGEESDTSALVTNSTAPSSQPAKGVVSSRQVALTGLLAPSSANQNSQPPKATNCPGGPDEVGSRPSRVGGGAVTPGSSRGGQRTPGKKGTMASNMAELRRRLEALTVLKRADGPERRVVSPAATPPGANS